MNRHDDSVAMGMSRSPHGTEDWLANRLRSDAQRLPSASVSLQRRIVAAIEREAEQRKAPRRRPARGIARWLPALAGGAVVAALAVMMLVPGKTMISSPGMTPAERLAELMPTSGAAELVTDSRELEALARDPLEQELAAVDAVISEFGEVLASEFGSFAVLARARDAGTAQDSNNAPDAT